MNDPKVFLLKLDKNLYNRTTDLGAAWHPGYSGHKKMAMWIIPYISTIMGWDLTDRVIEVDDQTNEKWKKLQAPEDVYPVRKNMSQYTQKKDNMRVIALNKKHICPFLNEQKLCRLVCTFGDDVLSKTCRVFPREIHKFLDQEEFFLMPSCPAVIDLMKKYPNCNYIETGAENIEKEKNSEFNELNFLRNVRSIFSDWMRRKEFDPQENLKHIFFAALELWRIWQENSNEDFLFSDDFNAQIKKNLNAVCCRDIHTSNSAGIKDHCFDISSAFKFLLNILLQHSCICKKQIAAETIDQHTFNLVNLTTLS